MRPKASAKLADVDGAYITRRQYNEAFGQPSPAIEVPDEGAYLLDWYFDCSRRLTRIHDGVCIKIPPSEWLAWAALTESIVYPSEYGILSDIDHAYVAAINDELEVARELAREAEGRRL